MQAKNGILKGEFKVKNGKLIKCKIVLSKSIIEDIKFHGDFFIYPEEKIEEIEEKMKGIKYEENEIRKALYESFAGVEIIGADIEDFLKAIMDAK
ncbi:MAG: lipoate--protein ligase family protein [Thermoplasmatales archaeon]|nr:lipoate--protein ligase family protein [Thermoplasmatales archaeon]